MGLNCHVYKSMKFIKKKLNREKFYSFKLDFSNFVANWRYKGYGKIQNFQLNISKIMPARPKNTGTWTVNITIDLHRWVLDLIICMCFILMFIIFLTKNCVLDYN